MTTETTKPDVAQTNGNGHATVAVPRVARKAKRAQAGELIEQAEKLRGALRDLMLQANELVKSLKQHRRQSKAVQQTLDSLRQLKTLGV